MCSMCTMYTYKNKILIPSKLIKLRTITKTLHFTPTKICSHMVLSSTRTDLGLNFGSTDVDGVISGVTN